MKSKNYDTSTDYQLPPGELWWVCRFIDNKHVTEILFTSDKTQTWYQANIAAQIMIREYYGGDCILPKYNVELWQPTDKKA